MNSCLQWSVVKTRVCKPHWRVVSADETSAEEGKKHTINQHSKLSCQIGIILCT